MGLIWCVVIKRVFVVDERIVILIIFGDDIDVNSWEVAHWVDQNAGEDVILVAGVLSVGSPNEV